jgi:dTMP kinase
MKVYFGASISLDRSLLPVYREIVKELKKLKHEVLSEYVVDPDLEKGNGLSSKELFERETETIDKADVVVAEVTSPSWGTAFLIEHALSTGKPVLALYYKDSDMPLPMMIEGHPELYVAHYSKGNIRTILKKNMTHFDQMNHKSGKLVVIDGTDGSGKGTQTELLLKYLEDNDKPNKYIDFPRYYTSFHGKMVARYLSGEFGGKDGSPYLSSLFYAMDRLTARDEMVDWLGEGSTVVANRYTTSSMAFQTARVPKKEQAKFLKWLYEMEYKEHKLPKEDLVIFLYVPVEISQKLIEKKEGKERKYVKGQKKDIYEADVQYQRDVLKLYLELAKKNKHWEVIKCVDSKGKLFSIEQVHKKIVKVMKKHKIV